uniref:Uncharacterized protein n=1 Tax=Oryza rufipogon TaxID=4529 RepID=A0A0E0PAD7_ORYRU
MGRRANSGLRSRVLSLSLNCCTDQKWISDIQGKSGIPLLPETDKLDASDHSPPLVGIACNMSRQQDAPKHRTWKERNQRVFQNKELTHVSPNREDKGRGRILDYGGSQTPGKDVTRRRE